MWLKVLQRNSRQNHYIIVEVWQDQKACTAHVMAGRTRQCRAQFQPLIGSLYDERPYTALD
jgi:quinol monooxygenase YgiN